MRSLEFGVPRGLSEEDIVEALMEILQELPPPDGVTLGEIDPVGTFPDDPGTLIFRVAADLAIGVAANLLTAYLVILNQKVKARLAGRVRLKQEDVSDAS